MSVSLCLLLNALNMSQRVSTSHLGQVATAATVAMRCHKSRRATDRGLAVKIFEPSVELRKADERYFDLSCHAERQLISIGQMG